MKINGTNVKGIKKAVGEYNKNYNKSGYPIGIIIFDIVTNTVESVSVDWYFNNQEIAPSGYNRYVDISDLIDDVYGQETKPTMTNIQAVLREYVI